MATAVTMPQLGESIVEGTVAQWRKQPGERVERDEPLLDISTDKIDTEIPSPSAGILLQIVANEGETVDVGAVLAYIGSADEEPTTSPQERSPRGDEGPRHGDGTGAVAAPAQAEKGKQGRPTGRGFVSPVVARIAASEKVDLEQVVGTGRQQRVTKKDILAFVAQRDEEARVSSRQQATPFADPPRREEGLAEESPSLSPDETLRPLSNMRRIIAEHMERSVRTSPHATTIVEVDMAAVVRHREAVRDEALNRGIPLTYTSYFIVAAAQALQSVPEVNSRFTAAGLVLNRRVHIGVAVALERGLVVPVIRDADESNLLGIARALDDLITRARSDALTGAELAGGTFTITNHGTGGSLAGTPIINQPQSAILGVGRIVKRPVVRSDGPSLLPSAADAIVIRPISYLSLSFDHRALDGADADRFLSNVVTHLETWPAP